jgi:hypothetical protein
MFQRSAALCAVTLAASLTASADFSYTTTQKTTGGTMAAMAGSNADRTSKVYFKGQKMKTFYGNAATIIDFGSQTITTINDAQKTYTVKKFSDLPNPGANATDVTFDVKDTGQKKVVNGFNASETIITMSMDMDTGRGGPPMKMQVEMELWIASDVPGVGDMRAFYQKNLASFPWAAMSQVGGNPGMQKAMAQMERKMAELNGVAVERVIRIKPAGGAGVPQAAQMPQMSAQQQAQMQAAMARLQQMQSQGGPAAAAAQQAMGRMGGMAGGAGPGSASGAGSMIEMTIDSSDFSNASVPESVFAVPAGYKQAE